MADPVGYDGCFLRRRGRRGIGSGVLGRGLTGGRDERGQPADL